MVKIRLQRGGAKKRPFYHIVVTDQRNTRDGRYIERLGFFNPVAVGGEVPLRLDAERVEYWKGRGAQLSERVTNLVKYFNRHGEGVAAPRAEPPVTKARQAPAQAVPAGASGDRSASG
jgi:small subunit ribosomal protein S16